MLSFLRVAGVFVAVVSAAYADWMAQSIAGTGVAGFDGDGGRADHAQVNAPFGIVRGPDDALWFCEYGGQRIRRISADGRISTYAGTGKKGYAGDGGPAIVATFNQPHELRFDADGNLFVADMANQVIRRIDAKTQVITTVAGIGGRKGYTGDGGLATNATLNSPHSIQFGPDGQLYICDVGNHVIRRLDVRTGFITTIAGTGRPGPTPDGAPLSGTPLDNPRSLDFDREGNLWLVTREGNQVLKLDLAGKIIHHIAGTGAAGFTGNGGPAKLATLSGPKGIAIDPEGNVWLADTESHTVRMIDHRTGTIELIAGIGSKGDGPDGAARECAMNRPHGLFVDRDGSVLVGDSEAHRIRQLRKK